MRLRSLLSRFLRTLASLAAAGTVVVVALTLAGFAASLWWRFDQACHFRVQYFWLLLLAATVLAVAKRWRLVALAAAAALINAITIAPLYWPTSQPPASGPTLRLVSFNLLSSNSRHREVLDFLRTQNADIVLLMEVNAAWAAAIDSLDYPHRHIIPRDDDFGIALLSRLPWSEVQTLELGPAQVPAIVANFDIGGSRIMLAETHLVPPGSHFLTARRNEQLAALAKLISGQDALTIVAGDLNTTEHSPCFRDFLAATNLRDTRQGFGIQPTWGPTLLLEIPIDHCLVSPHIAVRHRRTAPHLGSDHRPLILDLQFPASPQAPSAAIQ